MPVTNKPHGWFQERLLIVGMMPLSEQIVHEIAARPHGRRIVVGVVDDMSASTSRPLGCPLLGPMSRLAEIVDQVRPDRVLVALGERRLRTPVQALVESCVARGVIVEDAAEFYERITGKLAIESLTPTSIVFSRRFGPSHFEQAFARVVSLLMAIASLVILFPLLVLIALAVKLDSAGPVLFVQPRVGARGRPFRLLKFRTMHAAGARRSEWECDNRHRVTRVGRWLRAFRLDELPQFVNVLRGEMNVVGPRPHPVSNFELLTLVTRNLNDLTGSAIGYYTLRTMVRPGITGWAQVRYRYANNLEEEIEKLKYDLYYVKYASAGLDLRVLAQTFKVMLAGHAAPAADTHVEAGAVGLPANVTGAHAA
jgi:exopolysaccharide biosynthesis polyprenyl glycosylphosphotransferase